MWKSQTLLQGVFTVPWGPRGHPVTVFTILPATRCHFFFILREVLYYTLWRVAKKVGIGVGDSSDETPYITLPPVFFICLLQRSEHFFSIFFGSLTNVNLKRCDKIFGSPSELSPILFCPPFLVSFAIFGGREIELAENSDRTSNFFSTFQLFSLWLGSE